MHICLYALSFCYLFFFFFNDTATTEIYTLSLHDALPIWSTAMHSITMAWACCSFANRTISFCSRRFAVGVGGRSRRSEEHTSELQSQSNLVCRLLLEKKKDIRYQLRSHSAESRTDSNVSH